MSKMFDTLQVAHDLEEMGFTASQASGIAHALGQLVTSELATKIELAQVEANLKVEMRLIESQLKLEIIKLEGAVNKSIAELKSDLQRWVVGVVGFQIVAIAGLVAGLFKLLH